jgi:plasmid stabilization system protein ParE
MQIVFKNKFSKSLDNILDYIAKDGLSRSVKFNRQLQVQIKSIPNMPYKCRESFYYVNQNIRDMVFKGYTIPYLIDNDNNQIVILDIFKWINK